LKVPVNKAYKELDLAYNITHKIYNGIRQCTFRFVSKDDEFLGGIVEMVESYFGGRRRGIAGEEQRARYRCLGYLRGKVRIEIVKDVTAETLLREAIKRVKRGHYIHG